MILLIAIILGVVCLDQLTKWLTVIFIDCPYVADKTVCPDFASSTSDYVPIWEDVLHLVHHHNEGMAFGLLKDNRWVFMIFSTVAIVGILFYLIKFKPKSRWMQVSLAMIAEETAIGEANRAMKEAYSARPRSSTPNRESKAPTPMASTGASKILPTVPTRICFFIPFVAVKVN